jgi:hypothetical protein
LISITWYNSQDKYDSFDQMAAGLSVRIRIKKAMD